MLIYGFLYLFTSYGIQKHKYRNVKIRRKMIDQNVKL